MARAPSEGASLATTMQADAVCWYAALWLSGDVKSDVHRTLLSWQRPLGSPLDSADTAPRGSDVAGSVTRRLIQQVLDAEDLVRRRRADEYRRQVASQRAARVDPNPHQIDAVIFALSRIPEGGCILADEVGLGKTIEAGLVVAQLLAEGARRVLIVTPKALLGQWRQELYALFAIESREVSRQALDFAGEGVFLITRDTVGGEAGADALRTSERFDLCIIDEAHEVFAGIYRRYDRDGGLRDDAAQARIAGRTLVTLREAGTPVLLLTATPIQNSLLELWGLVQYVDPTGTLLGDLGTFRQIFCPTDDRVLEAGQEHELQQRLAQVLQRTLRRHAQDFMREPFMARRARLFEYAMSAEERALYDDVSRYLLEPNLQAFRGSQRQLLLLSFRRQMASSLPALARSLERVADRLRSLGNRDDTDDASDQAAVSSDLEDDEEPGAAASPLPPVDRAALEGELGRVESFIRRANALPTDSKARALCQAVQLVFEQARLGKSSRKVVIFTESLTTQDYLRRLLVESQLVREDEVTLFRGDNASPGAARALAVWHEEVGAKLSVENQPSTDVAMRLALVHEFRTRSTVLISTEAGAKGLNLQFCNTVINYDLPWNPQRIEQRIGRCHRYGQRRDVTVINFIAKDNETQRLTFEILSQKLELFGNVLGATDEVLHEAGASTSDSLVSALGTEFEAQLRRIYDQARTLEEVERELRALRDAMESRKREFEAAQRRTEEVIQRRFDATVQQAFRTIQQHLPTELEAFDRHVERVVCDYLEANGIPFTLNRAEGVATLSVPPSERLPAPLRAGVTCLVGAAPPDSPVRSLHLGHPLVVAAITDVREAAARERLRLVVSAPARAPELRGCSGRARIVRARFHGFETTERLFPLVLVEGTEDPVPEAVARELIRGMVITDDAGASRTVVPDEVMGDAVDQLMFRHSSEVSAEERERYDRTMAQVERALEDRILLLQRRRDVTLARLSRAETQRDGAVGSEQRNRADQSLRSAQEDLDQLDGEIAALRAGDDEAYQRWRERTHQRHYTRPEIATLFDAEFEIR
jgi:superfamily II DNA or RNA helicase